MRSACIVIWQITEYKPRHIREFFVNAPGKVWVSDITYIPTDPGWLYLAGVKDLFNGELVGYAMNERMTRHLVIQALFRATASKHPDKGLIAHSDSKNAYARFQ